MLSSVLGIWFLCWLGDTFCNKQRSESGVRARQIGLCFVLWVSYKQYVSILCLCSHTYAYVLENDDFLARETSSYFGWPVKEYYKEM